jgi:hypothetical protein
MQKLGKGTNSFVCRNFLDQKHGITESKQNSVNSIMLSNALIFSTASICQRDGRVGRTCGGGDVVVIVRLDFTFFPQRNDKKPTQNVDFVRVGYRHIQRNWESCDGHTEMSRKIFVEIVS